jgi:hypothetical protein
MKEALNCRIGSIDYILSSESDASSSSESEYSDHETPHEPIGIVRPRSFYTYADPIVVPKKKPTRLNSPQGSVFEDDSSSDSSSDESDELNSAGAFNYSATNS